MYRVSDLGLGLGLGLVGFYSVAWPTLDRGNLARLKLTEFSRFLTCSVYVHLPPPSE